MSRAKTFAGALTLVLLASCGASTKKAAPIAPPVSLAVTTTGAPTTAPGTTVPAPTLPPTTVATTTTTMSLKDLEQVVRQAVDDYWAAEITCIGAPASCDPSTFTQPDSAARTSTVSYVASLLNKKWIARQNASDPAVAVVESMVFNEKRTVATLKECLWDTGIAVQPNAGPNGEDIIVDESKASFENRVTMVLLDGKWITNERTQVAEHLGVNVCAGR